MSVPVSHLRLPEDHRLRAIGRQAGVVGVVALALCGVGLVVDPTQAYRSWLVAYVYWIEITVGALAIMMINHVTGGAWGAAIRRTLEAAAQTLVPMAILFVPVVVGLPHLYEWARPEAVAHDVLLQHKRAYLNPAFFAARAVFYFGVWVLFARALDRWSRAQDLATDGRPERMLEQTSRGGLVAMGLTMTFASIDWMMSLEPHWYSTIYGVLFMVGSALSSLAFAIVVARLVTDRSPLRDIVGPDQFHDLGKLLLAFTILWAYVSFSQFLIIWSGNLPEEIPWYLSRLAGPWRALGVGLVLFHFALPFAVLLSRGRKRAPLRLARVAGAMLVVRYVEVNWLVKPAFHDAPTLHWLDAAALLGIGGIWIALFVRGLGDRVLVPLKDPALSVEA